MAINKNNLIQSERMNEEWMEKALDLAKKGKGKVHGRPLVGCIIGTLHSPHILGLCS